MQHIYLQYPKMLLIYSLGKKATFHQVTMLATSTNVLFPGHNHLLTTGTNDPSLLCNKYNTNTVKYHYCESDISCSSIHVQRCIITINFMHISYIYIYFVVAQCSLSSIPWVELRFICTLCTVT